MTIILTIALGGCVASVLFLQLDMKAQRKGFQVERDAWRGERSELLNRIQAPDRIPVTPAPDFLVPEREPDEWHQVGQITISDKYGLDD